MRARLLGHTAPPPPLARAGEYIDDTEDLVLINLDYSRNKLIRFEIILTTGTFALAFYSWVALLPRARPVCSVQPLPVPTASAYCHWPRLMLRTHTVHPAAPPACPPRCVAGILGENLVLPDFITRVRARLTGPPTGST